MLSETPVLDKGSVAFYSSSPNGKDLLDLQREYFRGMFDERLLSATTVHLYIKCPLFVQLTFAEHGLDYLVQRVHGKPDAFVPNVNEIGAQTLETSEAIQADIARTIEALLLNPRAYQMDNCDLFIAQVVSPVAVYNKLLVRGTLQQWINYMSQAGLPAPIEAYRRAIEGVILAEYPQLKDRKVKK